MLLGRILFFSVITISAVAQSIDLFFPASEGQLVHHQNYSLAYSEEHEQALWVFYELDRNETHAIAKRKDDFREDPMVRTGSASLADYRSSGYDRGHLAPAADMAFSEEAISESFYMSNMSPQEPSFNRGIWKNLEAQFREWAAADGSLYIVTGPVLVPGLAKMGDNQVSIPNFYYKVALDFDADELGAIAFLLPNQKLDLELESFVVSIDSLESITGIDFFAGLDDDLEAKFEATKGNFTFWKKPRLKVLMGQDSLQAAINEDKSNQGIKKENGRSDNSVQRGLSKWQYLIVVLVVLMIVFLLAYLIAKRKRRN
tara:strand:+ start:43989 stop:44933 length:945 start_codon:yes stop_codon:yes gene_type:complete